MPNTYYVTYGSNILTAGSAGSAISVTSAVDPYNPLGLPDRTIRVKFSPGYTPTMGTSQTQVSSSPNIWDIMEHTSSWEEMFKDCTSLLEVLGANTNLTGGSGISSTHHMFSGCSNLTSIVLFDTYYVSSMPGMFKDCTSLTSIPLFPTEGVTSMSEMFSGCTALTSVPLLDTQSTRTMLNMFYNCSSLTTLPTFNTSRVEMMEGMCYGCSSLTQIPSFDVSNVASVQQAFYGCRYVQSGALSLYQQASSKPYPPRYYSDCFTNCGDLTVSGAAELAQIPSSWGGTGA